MQFYCWTINPESGYVDSTRIYAWQIINGVPKGIRTPVAAVKGQCPRPLDDGDLIRGRLQLRISQCNTGRHSWHYIDIQSITIYVIQSRYNKGSGGARRDRTADLLHAMQALSQLSYGPVLLSILRFTLIPGELKVRDNGKTGGRIYVTTTLLSSYLSRLDVVYRLD